MQFQTLKNVFLKFKFKDTLNRSIFRIFADVQLTLRVSSWDQPIRNRPESLSESVLKIWNAESLRWLSQCAIFFIFRVFSQVNMLQLLAIQWKIRAMKLSDSCQHRPYWKSVEFVYGYLKHILFKMYPKFINVNFWTKKFREIAAKNWHAKDWHIFKLSALLKCVNFWRRTVIV